MKKIMYYNFLADTYFLWGMCKKSSVRIPVDVCDEYIRVPIESCAPNKDFQGKRCQCAEYYRYSSPSAEMSQLTNDHWWHGKCCLANCVGMTIVDLSLNSSRCKLHVDSGFNFVPWSSEINKDFSVVFNNPGLRSYEEIEGFLRERFPKQNRAFLFEEALIPRSDWVRERIID